MDSRGVMVLCQWKEGNLLSLSKQLLWKGKQLARQLGEPLMAAALGCDITHDGQNVFAFGAEELYLIDDLTLKIYTATRYGAALELILQKASPSILLVGATEEGRDLAARVAAKMGTGLTADCTELAIQPEKGLLLQTRPAYGGRVKATIVCENRRPQMATVRKNVFPTPKPMKPFDIGKITNLSHLFHTPEDGISIVKETILPKQSEFSRMENAQVVVACGRGMQNQQGVQLICELAQALGGTVGASRGAVEDGLLAQGWQVGQTGSTIRPKLYIACGISGAVQHMAGIWGAQKIVAINHDPHAPIMDLADYAVWADTFEVLPKLIQMAHEIKNTDKSRNTIEISQQEKWMGDAQ